MNDPVRFLGNALRATFDLCLFFLLDPEPPPPPVVPTEWPAQAALQVRRGRRQEDEEAPA